MRGNRIIQPGLAGFTSVGEKRVPTEGEFYFNPVYDAVMQAGRGVGVEFDILRKIEPVVLEVYPEPTYQIAFSDKPLLELTRDEARQVFRELEELI